MIHAKGRAASVSPESHDRSSQWGKTVLEHFVSGLSGMVCPPWDDSGALQGQGRQKAPVKTVAAQFAESTAERKKKILLAYNGSELSQAALQAVIEENRRQNTEVEVLYAVDLGIWDGMGSQARGLVDQAAQRLQAAGFKAQPAILKGAISDVILHAASQWGADLIVLGWHGRTALRRFLFGSLADAVTNNAPCSVELVRMQRHAGG